MRLCACALVRLCACALVRLCACALVRLCAGACTRTLARVRLCVLCVCVCLCVSVSLSLSRCLSRSLSLCLSLCVSVCVSVCFCVCVGFGVGLSRSSGSCPACAKLQSHPGTTLSFHGGTARGLMVVTCASEACRFSNQSVGTTPALRFLFLC